MANLSPYQNPNLYHRESREEKIKHFALTVATEHGRMAGFSKEAIEAYVKEKLQSLPEGLGGEETVRWLQITMGAQLLNEAGW